MSEKVAGLRFLKGNRDIRRGRNRRGRGAVLLRQDFQPQWNAQHLFKCFLQAGGIMLGNNFPLKIGVYIYHHFPVLNGDGMDARDPDIIGDLADIVQPMKIIEYLRPGFLNGFHMAISP